MTLAIYAQENLIVSTPVYALVFMADYLLTAKREKPNCPPGSQQMNSRILFNGWTLKVCREKLVTEALFMTVCVKCPE